MQAILCLSWRLMKDILNGLLVIRQIDNTSLGGEPGGKLVPGSHKRCEHGHKRQNNSMISREKTNKQTNEALSPEIVLCRDNRQCPT